MSQYPMGSAGFLVEALTRAFASADLPDPALDARSLVCKAGGVSPLDLTLRPETPLSTEAQKLLDGWRHRRMAREPVTRILGKRGFWSFELTVAPGVLDPRPDSEVLVEACLKHLGQGARSQPLRILDAGAGSGALLAALLTELPEATGLAVDISPEAVALAAANLASLGLRERADVRLQRWDTVVGEIFDVVVSNPPYIASEEIDGLDPEVRLHDPHLALDGGQDGLEAYRSLARILPVWLKSSGLAAFEIGATQGPAVTGVLAAAGLKNISVVKDFSALDRVVIAHCR